MDILRLLVEALSDGSLSGEEVYGTLEELRHQGVIDLLTRAERQERAKALAAEKVKAAAEAAEAKRKEEEMQAEERRWLQVYFDQVAAETEKFLGEIGRSTTLEPIPFSRKQVETFQKYAQEVLGYDGPVLWYSPNGLRFRDFLERYPELKRMEDLPWRAKSYPDDSIDKQWVLWAPRMLPNSEKVIELKVKAMGKLKADVCIDEGAHSSIIVDVQLVYLTLLALRLGHSRFADEDWMIGLQQFTDDWHVDEPETWEEELDCMAIRWVKTPEGHELECKPTIGLKLKNTLPLTPAVACR